MQMDMAGDHPSPPVSGVGIFSPLKQMRPPRNNLLNIQQLEIQNKDVSGLFCYNLYFILKMIKADAPTW